MSFFVKRGRNQLTLFDIATPHSQWLHTRAVYYTRKAYINTNTFFVFPLVYDCVQFEIRGPALIAFSPGVLFCERERSI